MSDVEVLALIVGLVVVVLSWRNPLHFLAIHLIARFVLDSVPHLTYVQLAAGFTVMQLFTVFAAVFMAVYLTVRNGWTMSRLTPAVACITLVIVLSGLLNQQILGAFELGAKWMYLWVLSEFTLYSLQKNSPTKVIGALFVCYLYPLFNQLVFMIYGTPKIEMGLVNYKGSFDHESTTAFLLLGLVAIALVFGAKVRAFWARMIAWCAFLLGLFGLYMNTYRTALVAGAVFIVFLYARYLKKLDAAKWVAVNYLALIGVVGALFVVGQEIEERFQDIAYVVANFGDVIDFSGTARPNGLLSGRIDLINMYMYHFMEAGIDGKIIGLGPRSGNQFAGVYAHNEFVSTLVEYGVLGLLSLLFVLFVAMKEIQKGVRANASLYPFAAMFYGLVVMALGTMPFHDQRALILLAIILAHVLHGSKVHGARRRLHQRVSASTTPLTGPQAR